MEEWLHDIAKIAGGGAGLAIILGVTKVIQNYIANRGDNLVKEAEASRIDAETSILKKKSVQESQAVEISRLTGQVNELWTEHTKSLKLLQAAITEKREITALYYSLLSEHNLLKEDVKDLKARLSQYEKSQ